jgi:hypothetical protein
MEVGTTEMAIIGTCVVGAYKALDGLIAIVKLLISRNGKNDETPAPEPQPQPLDTQALLEKFIERFPGKDLCDERHKNIDVSLRKGSQKMDSLQSDVIEVKSDIIEVKAITNNILSIIKNGDN